MGAWAFLLFISYKVLNDVHLKVMSFFITRPVHFSCMFLYVKSGDGQNNGSSLFINTDLGHHLPVIQLVSFLE
jgi:hypothetical protein